jgi:urease accessory protein
MENEKVNPRSGHDRPGHVPSASPQAEGRQAGGCAKEDLARSGRLLRLVPSASALLAGLAWGGPAYAHSMGNRFGDFYGGVLHPLTALEHVLPFLALGLLAGQQGARAARWLVLTFPLGLLLGTASAAVAPAGSWLTPLNHVSFVVLGLLLATAWRIPLALLIALGFLFGLSHGYENGRAMTPETATHLFIFGVATIGGLVTALVSAATLDLAAKAVWPGVAVRIVGSWIAAIGIMMIGLA